jgi:hypothetical protein
MVMEMAYADIEERYRTRVLYAQPDDLAQSQAELSEAMQVDIPPQALCQSPRALKHRADCHLLCSFFE